MKKFRLASFLLGLGAAWSPLFSQAYTDSTAGNIPESYFIQGEYFGSWDDDGSRLGAHVRAAGNQYNVHFTLEGLPGPESWPMGGWTNQWRSPITGRTFSGGSMTISGSGWNATLTIPGNVRTAANADKVIQGTFNNRAFTLRRIKRTPPSMGMPPPPGATVLFDGTQQSFNDNWVANGGGSYDAGRQALYRGLDSRSTFQSCFLHVEFMAPYMPNNENQSRANSGIYLQRRYEQQIMDSFGEEGMTHDSKGGLYGSIPPAVNATLPPLVWETYDIQFTAAQFSGSTKSANARFTTWLNGIRVQDNREMPGPGTGGAPEGPGPGAIFLQNHGGDPVYFRNIWIYTNPANYPDTNWISQKDSTGSPRWKGCMDTSFVEYNPIAYVDNPDACVTPNVVAVENIISKSVQYSRDGLLFSIEENGNHRLQISDLRGRTLADFSGEGKAIYDLSGLKTGSIYVLSLTMDGQRVIRRIPVY